MFPTAHGAAQENVSQHREYVKLFLLDGNYRKRYTDSEVWHAVRLRDGREEKLTYEGYNRRKL